nr:hypothetical protein CFP56_60323 [Quercus suber]
MCGCVQLNRLSQLIPLLLQKYLLRVGNTFTCNVEAELHEIEIESIDVTRKAEGCRRMHYYNGCAKQEAAEKIHARLVQKVHQQKHQLLKKLRPYLPTWLGFVKRGETEQRVVSTDLQPPLDSGTTTVLLILFCNKSS